MLIRNMQSDPWLAVNLISYLADVIKFELIRSFSFVEQLPTFRQPFAKASQRETKTVTVDRIPLGSNSSRRFHCLKYLAHMLNAITHAISFCSHLSFLATLIVAEAWRRARKANSAAASAAASPIAARTVSVMSAF